MFNKRQSISLTAVILVLSGLASDFWLKHEMYTNQMEEICDNAIDDDMDGFIDLNDSDCICEIIDAKSLIPNPSFEEMDCCPNNRSQLSCAETWIQASEPTTDYIHTCGWSGWDQFPAPMPFPDGKGIMGFRDGRVRQNGSNHETNWKEYAGACLLGPLEANTSYRFEFDLGFVNSTSSPSINISFFGTKDCDHLPFGAGNQDFGCPTNSSNWINLGSKLVSGPSNGGWVKTSIEVTPSDDIVAIAIGPSCQASSNSTSTYYFFDNLILADIRSFEFKVLEIEHPCSQDFALEVPFVSEIEYQWYLNGVALIGEDKALLSRMYGEGDYQVRIFDDENCLVTKAYLREVPVIINNENVVICKEDVYPFGALNLDESGSYLDTFKSVNNCDSIVFLELKKLGELADSIEVKIFEGDVYKIGDKRIKEFGQHLVTLESSIGCDSLVLVDLSYYKIFIPNVFSPNNDGENDEFKIFGEEELILDRSIKVFDRWGASIFSGEMWDGRINGERIAQGVYTYLATLVTVNGEQLQRHGSITLLR